MKFNWIFSHSNCFRIKKMASVLNVSTSGYYAFLNRPQSNRTYENNEFSLKIRRIFYRSRKTYGSPRIHAELKEQGTRIGHGRVERIMRSSQISPQKPCIFRVRTTISDPTLKYFENHLNQSFAPGRTGEVYVSDITYIRIKGGFAYLSTVMDLGNREIIGWDLSESLESRSVANSLERALNKRPIGGASIFHSDRGIQYISAEVRKIIQDNKIQQSMSRRGNCYDNAVQESFYGTLKRECIRQIPELKTFREMRQILFDYIEVFYNRKRRHSALGFQSPKNYIKITA